MKRYIRSEGCFTEEERKALENEDTSGWAEMQTRLQEDEIREAGSYSEYVRQERNARSRNERLGR